MIISDRNIYAVFDGRACTLGTGQCGILIFCGNRSAFEQNGQAINQLFQSMREIGIHDHDAVVRGRSQPLQHRQVQVAAAVAPYLEANGEFLSQSFCNLFAAVSQSVVDQQQLPLQPSRGEGRMHRADERIDVVDLTVDGCDH